MGVQVERKISARCSMFRRCRQAIIAAALAIAVIATSARGNTSVPPADPSRAPSQSPSTPSSSPSPAEIPFGTPLRRLLPSYPVVIYVVGLGADANTRGKLISELVRELSGRKLVDNAWIVPRPDWTLDDYVSQCASDSEHTEGALIAAAVAAANGGKDRLFSRTTYTEIAADVLYAQCFPDASRTAKIDGHKQAPRTAFVWQSKFEDRTGYHTEPMPLPALSVLLAFGAGLATFLPAKSGSSTTTRVFPVMSPIPGGGAVSQVVTGSTSTTNSSSLADISTAVLAQSFTYTANLTKISNDDEQAWNAANQAMSDAVSEANCPFAQASPAPTPSLSPARSLSPSPSPKPAAPFCGTE